MTGIVIALAALSVLLLSGCPAKEEPAVATADSPSAAAATAVTQENQAFLIRHNGGFYDVLDTDEMKWITSGSIGDKVELLGETKEAWFGKSKTKYAMVKVLYQGKEYWTIDWQLSATPTLGAVLADGVFLCKGPSITSLSDVEVGAMQIVAVLGEERGFYKVALYHTGKQGPYPNKWLPVVWLPKDKVSVSEGDIETAKIVLVATLKTGDDAEALKKQKRLLLQDALGRFPGSAFSDVVANMLAEIDGKVLVDQVTVSYTGSDSSTRDVSVIENTPIFFDHDMNSGVMLQVSFDVVLTIGKTAEVAIGNGTERWYHVLYPVDGWIQAGAVVEE